MFESSYEIVGLICIVIGAVMQIFGIGKNQNAELEDKTFKLKGNPGLIFAGLGVVLLTAGAAQSPEFIPALFGNPAKTLEAQEWWDKGFALEGMNRYEEALDAYNKSLEIDPKYPLSWIGRGTALIKIGRYNEALESFDRALLYDDKSTNAWFYKGRVLYDLGRYQEALDSLNRVLEIDPKDETALVVKGHVLYDLGRYQEALESYNKALEIDPQDKFALDSRDRTLTKLNGY